MTDLDPAQRWILAVPALLNELNGDSHELVGGAARPLGSRNAMHILSTAWAVHSPADAVETIAWLTATGNRGVCSAKGHGSVESFHGWDFGRAATVAGWSYLAYLLDLETAWSAMKSAALIVQASFGSFAEFGQSYMRGLEVMCGNPKHTTVTDAQAALGSLVSCLKSPFLVPWKTSLADAAAPVVAPREARVVSGGSIGAAIVEVGPGGRILVGPGTYRESLEPEHGVEIVASGEGEVVIEGDGLPALRVGSGVAVAMIGIALRGGLAPGDTPLNAVHVRGGYAHLAGCDIRASHNGIFVREDGALQLFGSRVHDCGRNGVEADAGDILIADTEITGAAVHGIARVNGANASAIRGCRVLDAGKVGIFASGTVAIRDTRVEGAGHCGVVVEGTVDLTDVVLAGSRGCGMCVQKDAQVHMNTTIIEGSAGANLDVLKGRIQVVRSTIRGGATSGVLLQGGARATFAETTVEDNAKGNVVALDASKVIFYHCTIRGGGAGGVWTRGSDGWYHATIIENAAGPGVEVVGPSSAVFTDCEVLRGKGDGVVIGAGGSARFSRFRFNDNAGAGLVLGAGATALIEDGESCDNGEADRDDCPTAVHTHSSPAATVALDPVEEHKGTFEFGLRGDPAVAKAFVHRKAAPDLDRLARMIVRACGHHMEDLSAVDFGIVDGRFFARAASRDLAVKVREVAIRALESSMYLRKLSDDVELVDWFDVVHRQEK